MARQDANEAFLQTSFLYGGNARLHRGAQAEYENDPNSVDPEWRAFFAALKDDGQRRREERPRARPGSGRTGRSPPNGELVSALDGNWAAIEQAVGDKIKAQGERQAAPSSTDAEVQQATRDSVRAMMMIRAYRMRGHLHANLDPAGPRAAPRRRGAASRRPTASPRPTRTARSSSTTCSASSSRTIREMLAILKRTYCSDARRRVHAHLRPDREGLDPGAHRGAGQGDHLHPRGQARDPQQADRGRGLREVPRRQVHRHQALRPRRRRSR